MIATLTGMGGVLSAFFLALILRKPKKVLGDEWLAVWFGLYLAFFGSFAVMQQAANSSILTTLALTGQIAAILLTPAQFLHAWAFTAGSLRDGFLLACPAALLVLLTLILPLNVTFRVEAGAMIADVPPWYALVPIAALLGTMAYPVAAIARIRSHRSRLKQRISNLHTTELVWMQAWGLSTVALLLLQLVIFLISLSGWLAVPLHVALLVFGQVVQVAFVGWRGISQTGVFLTADGDVFSSPSKLDLANARLDFAALSCFVATREPHLDGTLTAGDLADRIGWARFRLTRALQLGGETSFHDFLNSARVETIKRLALEPRNASATLLSLALDAGFGSKSAFYTAFLAAEGMSPARWRAIQAKK